MTENQGWNLFLTSVSRYMANCRQTLSQHHTVKYIKNMEYHGPKDWIKYQEILK